MGRRFSRQERVAGARPRAADLREWVEDFVAVHPAAGFEECAAALSAAGYPMPPSDGWEPLQAVWDEAQVQVLDNWRY